MSYQMFTGSIFPATVLPVLSAHPLAVYASGLLFGGVFLSVVASTTAGGVTHPTAPTSLGAPIFTLPVSGWSWQV